METHPDCFAGYTRQLKEEASRVVLSSDKHSAFIGRIQIDLTSGIYLFERWLDDSDRDVGVHLIWRGEITMGADGLLAVSPPLISEETYADK